MCEINGSRGKLMLAKLGIRLQKTEKLGCWHITSVNTTSQNPEEEPEFTILPTFAESGTSQNPEGELESTIMPTIAELESRLSIADSECSQIADQGELLRNETSSVPDLTTSTLIAKNECSQTTEREVMQEESSDSSSSSSRDASYAEVEDSDQDPDYSDSQSSSTSSSSTSTTNPLENEIQKAKSRKRKAAPATWRRNQSKLLRNTGKPYKSLKKNKTVNERKVRAPCGTKCRTKCSTKFSEEERITIFQKYWAMGDINKQRAFVVHSMQKVRPQYRYALPEDNNKYINLNNAFFFEKSGDRVRVCKSFFTATLDISSRCIRTVISKNKDGFLTSDCRGKHENHVQVPKQIKDGIRTHILSIPVLESHYTREHSSKKYIEGGKTIAQLYRDYKDMCEKEGKPVGNLTMYTRTFNYEFFSPKKDQCLQCVSYLNLSSEDQSKAEAVYRIHLEEKELSRKEKETDKNSISDLFQVSCFDLQAALPTPRGEISSFYYKSKLSTYNFTICELQKKGLGDVYCYLWHEGEAKKGSTEIGSCLLKFLEEKAARCNTDGLGITLYSDNCCGQQKNKFVIASYLYAVAKFRIKSITHKFLVVGHTQNEGDCAHSIIEKNIKRSLKSGPIYVPSQYTTLIRTARKQGNRFKLFEMGYEDFYDLKDLTNATTCNFTQNTKSETVHFNDISIIKVEKHSPDKFFYKTSYKQIDFETVNINSSRSRKKLISFDAATLKKAYSSPNPISKKKFDDLQSLIASNAVPRCYSNFYNSLKFETK